MKIVKNDLFCTLNVSETLPDELILNIFQYLPLTDVSHCFSVNKRWSKLASDPILWKPLIINSLNYQTEKCIQTPEQFAKIFNQFLKQIKLGRVSEFNCNFAFYPNRYIYVKIRCGTDLHSKSHTKEYKTWLLQQTEWMNATYDPICKKNITCCVEQKPGLIKYFTIDMELNPPPNYFKWSNHELYNKLYKMIYPVFQRKLHKDLVSRSTMSTLYKKVAATTAIAATCALALLFSRPSN